MSKFLKEIIMCLISKNKEPFIANKDIKCYKIVFKFSNFWVAPITSYKFKYGHLIDNSPASIHKVWGVHCSIYLIKSGFFHAFVNKESAEKEYSSRIESNLIYDHIRELDILECIIPKGAKYYIGKNNDVCASEIIINNDEKEI